LLLALSSQLTFSQEDGPRLLQGKVSYVEPLWWSRISSTFTGTEKLEQCRKRLQPPINGTKCAKSKTCYFGTQVCSDQTTHPTTKCVCLGDSEKKQWQCQPELCPPSSTSSSPILTPSSPPTSILSPTPLPSNGCDANGRTIHKDNDALCPVPGPLDSGFDSNFPGCVPALFDKTCSYGTEKWCVV
jgi:hypothetical protein